MDPIMMDEEQTKEIISKVEVMRNKRPYQYKINSKKREVTKREGLNIDEKEVEDLCAIGKIEEIFHATYERKTRGQGYDIE